MCQVEGQCEKQRDRYFFKSYHNVVIRNLIRKQDPGFGQSYSSLYTPVPGKYAFYFRIQTVGNCIA